MWSVPLGYLPAFASAPGGGRAWGSPNLGGALLTASGLVFIAGTYDRHLRAFDIETGKEVWGGQLPAASHALPMSYVIGRRQYVVVVAGGHDRLHSTMGDFVLAFALPAPGTPMPDTIAGSLDGHWKGEMHIGDARFGMRLVLRSVGDSVAAEAQLDSIDITGPVTARQSGRGVTVSFPFHYAAKQNCTGTVTTTVSLWNGGSLLEGGGTLDGPCADRGRQDAAFVFRRE
jgi:hypothetical protein